MVNRNLHFCLAMCLVTADADASVIQFTNRAAFLQRTGAIDQPPVPNVGPVSTPYVLGDMTITLGTGALQLVTGDWTVHIPGNEFLIEGTENFVISLSSSVYAFGFVEPEFDPNVGGPFVDSLFWVRLYNSDAPVTSFYFDRPNDQLTFVGMWTESAFNRIEIREILGSADNEFFANFLTGGTPSPEPATVAMLLMLMAVPSRRRLGNLTSRP